MGRKITMTGKKAQYIERRAADALADNDREIIMEGEEAIYREFAGENAKEEANPIKVEIKELVLQKHVENEIQNVAAGGTGVNNEIKKD